VEDASRIQDLAVRARGGDGRALDDLLREVRPQVLAHCRRLLNDERDAEEACQNALLKAARSIDRYEERSRFTTWLFRITTNAARDVYRTVSRRRSVLGELPDEPAPSTTSMVAVSHVDLVAAVDRIDPLYAEPVLLRDVLGLDYGEIATQLGIPAGTVKSRIHEGRRRLQRQL
jgi:RNA polymerase sigma factor (sigma-70 family)